MKIIQFFSNIAMPMVILIILLFAILEKKKSFDTFLKGASEGVKISLKIFPTLLGLFVAISLLRNSGLIDFIINIISPVLEIIKIPKEIMPIAILRPISGSASIAVATDIMKNYGVDTYIGLIVSTIMGSTETTIYTISVYSSSVGINKTRFVLLVALIADVIGMIASVVVCRIMSGEMS